MSQFYEYNWPAPIANGISLFQLQLQILRCCSMVLMLTKLQEQLTLLMILGLYQELRLAQRRIYRGLNFLLPVIRMGFLLTKP